PPAHPLAPLKRHALHPPAPNARPRRPPRHSHQDHPRRGLRLLPGERGMKTLFAKLLLWFLVTTAAAVFGIAAISVHLRSGPIAQQSLLRALRFHSRDAVHAYEEGGREQLAQFLERL